MKFINQYIKYIYHYTTDPITSEKFYRAVVQAVLLFGAETWVLLSAMLNKIEGVHVGFL